MIELQAAWLAGLIEGDGCFALSGKSPVLKVKMADLDVLQKAQRYSGVGNITGPEKLRKPHHKPLYTWMITKRADVEKTCKAIAPFLGARRTKRMLEVINAKQHSSVTF